MARIQFKIYLSEWPLVPSDIASGELVVKIFRRGSDSGVVGDVQRSSTTVPVAKGQMWVGPFEGETGDGVGASFYYVNTAGQRSPIPTTLLFTLVDPMPPPTPKPLICCDWKVLPDEPKTLAVTLNDGVGSSDAATPVQSSGT